MGEMGVMTDLGNLRAQTLSNLLDRQIIPDLTYGGKGRFNEPTNWGRRLFEFHESLRNRQLLSLEKEDTNLML
jgi:hypothetical protein